MEESKERKFVCKFCDKKFPSGKSLGGHIRIHTNENSVDSDSYNGKRLRKNPEKNNRLVDQREIVPLKKQQQQQLCCRECGVGFFSLKALCAHMDCHSMVMDIESDTETSSVPTRKRSKRIVKQSNSESFSNGSSSSVSAIDHGAFSLMMMSRDSNFKKGYNLVVNSLAESSDNNSVIQETKSSSGEQLKSLNLKNQVLETDKVADDELRSAEDNDVILCDSDSSDSDYYINGPKKSESDIPLDRSLRNTGFNHYFRNTNEGGSKYELSKTKRVFSSCQSDAHSLETDFSADINSKFHRSGDCKSPMVNKACGVKKKSKGHECPICYRVFKSGQALGGHKRSHFIGNQEHRIEHQTSETRNPFNLPASDPDE